MNDVMITRDAVGFRKSGAGALMSSPTMMPFIRNCWYVAALSREVGRNLLHRRLLGEPVVLYRTESGEAAALHDRCPHRGLPLSDGALIGDNIQCAYHGIQFGQDGGCKLVPSQAAIPSGMKVRSFPVVETWQWIWIWMGDPDRADPALIPDHDAMGLGKAGWHSLPRFCMEIKGNYQLLHENLLDTSHITYLHPGLLDSNNAAEAAFDFDFSPSGVRIEREIYDATPGIDFMRNFDLAEPRPLHRKLSTATFGPNFNLITNVIRFADAPGEEARINFTPSAVTPATMNSCYHFPAVATNYPRADSPEREQRMWALFSQDKNAIEAIQRLYDELGPNAPEISVKADAAALRIRRIFAELATNEAN